MFNYEDTGRFRLGGKFYRLSGFKGKEVLLTEDAIGGEKRIVSKEWLESKWDSNDFGYEPDFYKVVLDQRIRDEKPVDTLAGLPQRYRQKALWRQAYCDKFLTGHAEGKWKKTNDDAARAAKEIEPEVDALGFFKDEIVKRVKRGLSPTSPRKQRAYSDVTGPKKHKRPRGEALLKWVRKYVAADLNPVVLADNTDLSGWYGAHLVPSLVKLMQRQIALYLDDKRITKTKLAENIKTEVTKLNLERRDEGQNPLKAPSPKTIYAYLDKIDPFYRDVRRHGLNYALKRLPRQPEQPEIELPGQRIEIDEYQLDVMALAVESHFWELLPPELQAAIERLRKWLSIAICYRTKCVLGARISDAPSAVSAMSTLSMIMEDKTAYSDAAGCLTPWDMRCGLIGVVGDGGYTDERTRECVANAKGMAMLMPKGAPGLRGTVESMFRTVAMRLMEELEGKTFSNPIKAEDYKSALRAGLTVDELALILVIWIVDIYHNTPHSGLNGMTPREAWHHYVDLFGVRPPLDAHGRRSAFGQRVKRVLQPEGIELFGLFYRDQGPLKALYDPEKVKEFDVLVDTSNLGAISVVIGQHAVKVLCSVPWMEGVQAVDWIETNKRFQEENAGRRVFELETVRTAMERIRAINGDAMRRQLISAERYSAEEILAIQEHHFAPYTYSSVSVTDPTKLIGQSVQPIELPQTNVERQQDDAAREQPGRSFKVGE